MRFQEQFWCYRRLLKIKWTDRIRNEEVLRRMNMENMSLYNSIKKQKRSYAGHVLRGSAGKTALLTDSWRQDECYEGTRKTKTHVDWRHQKLDEPWFLWTVVATFTPRSSHISNATFTHSLLLASRLAAGRRSAPRDKYYRHCCCSSIRC